MVLVHSKVLGRRQPLASQLQRYCPSIGDKLLQQERPGVNDSVPLAFQTTMEVNNREGMPSSHLLKHKINSITSASHHYLNARSDMTRTTK